MAKITPFPLAPDALPRVRGVLIVRNWRGLSIAQKWPRKRGKPTNPRVVYTSLMFSRASQMAANSEPMQYETARYLTQGSHWMPRDLLVMAAYGKAYEITLADGRTTTQADHSPPEV